MTKPEDTTNKHIIIRRIETSGLRRWRSQGPKRDQRIALVLVSGDYSLQVSSPSFSQTGLAPDICEGHSKDTANMTIPLFFFGGGVNCK